jgi:hypothetical protein
MWHMVSESVETSALVVSDEIPFVSPPLLI